MGKEIRKWVGQELKKVCGTGISVYSHISNDLEVRVTKYNVSYESYNTIVRNTIYFEIGLHIKNCNVYICTQETLQFDNSVLLSYVFNNLTYIEISDLLNQIYNSGIEEGKELAKEEVRKVLGFED